MDGRSVTERPMGPRMGPRLTRASLRTVLRRVAPRTAVVGPRTLLVGILGAIALACGLAVPALAAKEKLEGKAGNCSYVLEFDSEGRSFTATISQCGGSLKPEGELQASWQAVEKTSETSVELGSVKLSLLGHEETFEPKYTFSLPLNLDELIARYEEVKKLVKEGKKTAAELKEAKEKVEEQFKKSVTAFASQLIDVVARQLANPEGAGIPDPLKKFNEMASTLNSSCEATGTELHDPFCSPFQPNGPACNPEQGQCPLPAVANDGNVNDGDGEDAEDSEADHAQLCPVVNSVQDGAVFVCVPSIVTGNLDTGNKPLVIIGGGALMMVPGASGEATISSNKAIVALGGVVVGDDLKLKAPDIAMAGNVLDAIGDLEYAGDRVSIGKIDGADVLQSVTKLPQDWFSEIVETAGLHTTFEVPAFASARHTTVKASETFTIAAGSKLAGQGLGSLGGDFESGIDPTGESEGFGGSHGGLGGYTITSFASQSYDKWYEMQGRSPVFDDPFKPLSPGDGGGGAAGDALGLSGGGTVQIESPEADVTIDGKVDVSGFETGLEDETSNGDHGGAGAGGSVYIAAEQLSGSGAVDANGGGHCAKEPEECVNGFGGSGGGGRIAALFEEDPSWSGHLEAHGGVDREFTGADPEVQFLGSGGAGTVFTRSVKFDDEGAVEQGTGAFPEGTLTIDGGRALGAYPPPDGTPLLGTGAKLPHGKLVIDGEARVYATELEYGEIALSGGGVLSTGISAAGENKGQIPTRLSVKAQTLSVDPTSVVSMTGRGLLGGEASASHASGQAAAGQSASSEGHGGSHGGAGGSAGAHESNPAAKTGSVYDSAEDPTLPGGGGGGFEGGAEGNAGGGVLDVTVGTLNLQGALSADGQSGDGPTPLEPAPFDFDGGGGGGGSVLVHAGTITGSGRITALGGNSCVPEGVSPLLTGAGGCGVPDGSGGGGGGGRVALFASAACAWTGSVSAAGGVDVATELVKASEEALREAAEAMRGGAGSTLFPTLTGQCSEPKEEPKEAPKEEGPGHKEEGAGNEGEHKQPQAKGAESGGGGKPPQKSVGGSPSPSNSFTIVAKKTVAKTGAEVVTVSVPGAGALAGVETASIKRAGKHHPNRPATVGRASASAGAAGKVKLTFTLTSAAREYLRKHGKLSVRIKIGYTPTGGAPASKTISVTLTRPPR